MVDEGVKTVTKDIAQLSEAVVEDSKATYSAFSEATYSTIEQVSRKIVSCLKLVFKLFVHNCR